MQLDEQRLQRKQIIWQDKKRHLGLPISFTTYTLDEETLHINKGFLNLTEDEIKLYRILDISLSQTLMQRIFKVGTIHCCSSDRTLKDFDIINIAQPKDVKELLSQQVEHQRTLKRVSSREFMTADYDDDEFN